MPSQERIIGLNAGQIDKREADAKQLGVQGSKEGATT
jgi:hypothetical protein